MKKVNSQKQTIIYGSLIGIVAALCICPLVGVHATSIIEVAPQEEMYDGLMLSGPQVVWKSVINGTLAEGMHGSVDVAEEAVILCLKGIPSDEGGGHICRLNRQTGGLEWIQHIGLVEGGPLVQGGNVYVGLEEGSICALSLANGEEVWRKQTESESQVGVPTYIEHHDENLLVGLDKNLYSLAGTDGKEQWNFDVGGTMYAAPVIEQGTVYAASSAGKVHALEALQGTLRWVADIEPGIFFLNIHHEEDAIALFWCEYERGERVDRESTYLSVFDTQSGKELARKEIEGREMLSWPIKGFMKLFFTRGNTLYALDFKTTEEVWSFVSEHHFFPALCIADDILIAADIEVTEDAAQSPTYVYAFNCETGEQVWTYELEGGMTIPFTVNNDVVCSASVMQDEDGQERYYVFFLDRTTGTEKGRVLVKPGEEVLTPIRAEGNEFYVTTAGSDENTYIYKLTFEEAKI